MAPRRRVSRSWTHVAATKSAGAVTAPNRSCASRRPSESPVHEGRQTISTNPNAAIIGRRRIARSGFIQRQLSGISVSATCVAALADLIAIELFYDHNCPFEYRTAELLELGRASCRERVV